MALACAVTAALVLAMLYEVVARYGFNAPTLWAFDVSYMLNGCLFLLGAAYALRENAHVRIDFLYQRMPSTVRRWLDLVMFLAFLLPVFTWLTWIAGSKAVRAWVTGEVEAVSPWAPLMWPFYAVLALGLAVFTLQVLAEGLRRLDPAFSFPDTAERANVAARDDEHGTAAMTTSAGLPTTDRPNG